MKLDSEDEKSYTCSGDLTGGALSEHDKGIVKELNDYFDGRAADAQELLVEFNEKVGYWE